METLKKLQFCPLLRASEWWTTLPLASTTQTHRVKWVVATPTCPWHSALSLGITLEQRKTHQAEEVWPDHPLVRTIPLWSRKRCKPWRGSSNDKWKKSKQCLMLSSEPRGSNKRMSSRLSFNERKSKGWLLSRQKRGAKLTLRNSEVNKSRGRRQKLRGRLSSHGSNSYWWSELHRRRSRPGSSVKGH